MKNSFLLLTAMLFFAGSISAQTSLRLSTSRQSSPSEKSALRKQFNDYELVSLDQKSLSSLRHAAMDGLTLKTKKLGEVHLVAQENTSLIADYQAFITADGKQQEDKAVKEAKHYTVVSKSNPDDVGRFTTFRGKCVLSFSSHGEKWYIEPASNFIDDDSTGRHVLYSEKDIIKTEGNRCLVTEIDDAKAKYENRSDARTAQNTPYSVKTIRVAIDADYETYTIYKTFTNVWILAVMNQVEEIYWRELKVKIKVVYQNAYATINDPYVQTTNSVSALYEFKDYWNASRQNIGRDIAILWTGKPYSDVVGRAFIGKALCNDKSFAYAWVSGTVGGQDKIAAHELGHSLGADHDTEIMGTLNYSQIFSTFSKNQINTHISTKTCFVASSDCNVLNRPGSSFNNPINIYINRDESPYFVDVRNNSSDNCYTNFMGQASNDIYYKVLVGAYGQLKISHCSSSLYDTYLHRLSSTGTILSSNDDYGPVCNTYAASMIFDVNPGDNYYFMSEGYGPLTGEITTSMGFSGPHLTLGASANNPIDAGVITPCNPGFSDYKHSPNPSFIDQYGGAGDDIFYRFTINSPQLIKIGNCNEYLPFGLYLLDANYNLLTSSSGAPECDYGGYIEQTLPAGTYFVISEVMDDYYPELTYGVMTNIWSASSCKLGESDKDLTSNFSVVPDRHNDKILVRYPESLQTHIEIIGLDGKVLRNESTDKAEHEFSSTDIHTGIYIARITQEGLVKTIKFSMVK